MRSEGEPSVEEILESIKKVIARDNRESGRQRRPAADVVEAEPAFDPVQEEDADADVLDLGDEGEMVVEDAEDSTLTNAVAARAMRDSLAALAMIAEPSQPPRIVRSGETSLEGLARELLRPMLAKWLDDNLPDMVERLVKAEITRIAHKQR